MECSASIFGLRDCFACSMFVLTASAPVFVYLCPSFV
jgi:hypothetical protein